MKNRFCIKAAIVLLIVLLSAAAAESQFITHHNAAYQGDFTKPAAMKQAKDPVFGTGLIRITDCNSSGRNGIVPQYSKRMAWNCNESLLLLQTCSGELLLLDGMNYQFIRSIDNVYGDDVFWHSSNPGIIYCAMDSIFYEYTLSTGELTPVRIFSDYTWINTRGEGNMSNDSRFYAFVGQTYTNEDGTKFEGIILFDVNENRVVSQMKLPNDLVDFDWVSISPKGRFVVVDYATAVAGRYNGVEVYDSNFNFIWQKPLGAGHSDLGTEENGDEVLVMTYYNEETNEMEINKYRLSDGAETKLLTHNWSIYNHISCRNLQRNGWCFVSTYDGEGRLADGQQDWLPFEDEIFALKLDGSGQVQRLAHHRSKRFTQQTPDSDNSVYFAEPHASVSPSGSRVVFGSNWRQNVSREDALDTYIVDFRDWLGVNESNPDCLNKTVSISGQNGNIRISLFFNKEGNCRISAYNILGGLADTEAGYSDGAYPLEINLGKGSLPAGLYFIIIESNSVFYYNKFILSN